jgi:hypothetical protein
LTFVLLYALNWSSKQTQVKTMTSFEVTVYDELNGSTDTLTIQAKTIDQVIDVVESNPNHEYEIIEIERINPWNA